MKIATWNVNSIRARMAHLTHWLKTQNPDVLCVQETKVVNELFPINEIKALGYDVAFEGQKSYNGVAILSKLPIKNVESGFPSKKLSDEKRLIRATIQNIEIINVYVPNGFELGHEKFNFKMKWLDELRIFLDKEFKKSDPIILCGDFNIALDVKDVHEGKAKEGGIHFSPEEHKKLAYVTDFGLLDIWRTLHINESEQYSWWDYRSGSFQRNKGMRIDQIYVTEILKNKCTTSWMDVAPRKLEKPSDHIPVIVEIT